MTFTSYAQTYEDVMLARAFAGRTEGFYIDVGAQDPRFDSVTKAFYDLGWHGINLEPVEHWHRKLVADRPELGDQRILGFLQILEPRLEVAGVGLKSR